MLAKLRSDAGAEPGDLIGGSTYTLEVWEGHPLEEECVLWRAPPLFERVCRIFWSRIAANNATTAMLNARTRVVILRGTVLDELRGETA